MPQTTCWAGWCGALALALEVADQKTIICLSFLIVICNNFRLHSKIMISFQMGHQIRKCSYGCFGWQWQITYFLVHFGGLLDYEWNQSSITPERPINLSSLLIKMQHIALRSKIMSKATLSTSNVFLRTVTFRIFPECYSLCFHITLHCRKYMVRNYFFVLLSRGGWENNL